MQTLSVEHVRAFVELANAGSIRVAARMLHLSEGGVRSRLLALEQRMGVDLYEKERGRRTDVRLTHAGQLFLTKATQFLDESSALSRLFEPGMRTRTLHIATSQYLAYYLLADIVSAFKGKFPQVDVRMITRTEQQVACDLESDTRLSLGVCAPIEHTPRLEYRHWFSMRWHFVAQPGHPLLHAQALEMSALAREPLILFEPYSTGRQHVLEAFYRCSLAPRIVAEATTTQLMLKMVEAGLGTAIVPMLPSASVTRGLSVAHVPLGEQIRPIDSGVLRRRDEPPDKLTDSFVDFLLASPLGNERRAAETC